MQGPDSHQPLVGVLLGAEGGFVESGGWTVGAQGVADGGGHNLSVAILGTVIDYQPYFEMFDFSAPQIEF